MNYLWFSKGDGWQVTSFDPRKDPALGVPDVKLYVPLAVAKELIDAIQLAYNHMPGQCNPGEAVYMDTTLERALTKRRDFIDTGYPPVEGK